MPDNRKNKEVCVEHYNLGSYNYFYCPSCAWDLFGEDEDVQAVEPEFNYCPRCGQKLKEFK